MGDIELLKAMGERIFRRRKMMKITQEQFAELLGVSTQMVSNLELGKKAIRPENLIKVSSVLGVSTDYLLKGTESKTEYEEMFREIEKLLPEEIDFVKNTINFLNLKK